MNTREFLFICFLVTGIAFSTQAHAQNLSYFPLETGNSWTYRVVPHGLPPSHSFDTVMTVGSDTLMPNGKRYLQTSWGALRVDSTSGIVWKYEPYPSRPLTDSTKHCIDTTETEFVNLSVNATSTYTLCPGPPNWYVSVPDTFTTIGQLPIHRKALYWNQWLEKRSFADSIGLFFIEYNYFVYTTWELIRADVYATVYTPVELEYLRASAGEGTITLHWRTAQETENMGFEVQRRHDGSAPGAWEVRGFVRAHGARADYSYVDQLDNALMRGDPLEYRLKQLDYNGSHWYSPRVRVSALSAIRPPYTIEIYPVPVSNRALIRLHGHRSQTISYTVYSLTGKRVVSGTHPIAPHSATELELEMTGIPAGIYYLQVREGGTVYGMTFPFMPQF
ncbi:MAG: hypothetical protein C0600_02860 [Ignavibacteria bacterium]|nr:MAG: hypothetical protein C0600_02860 [Ignavibacteria bacterium]